MRANGKHLLLAALLLALAAQAAPGRTRQDDYRRHFEAAERAKQAGDFAAMEADLHAALRVGPGDEYAWRSLAWAQARQGKWAESLANARENIRRNGESAWSLRQLFDSALSAGDLKLAKEALDRADRLPPDRRNADTSGDRRILSDLTATRVYAIEWKVDPKQGGPGSAPARILVPQSKYKWQTFDYTVENAVSWKRVREEGRDFIEVVQKPGEVPVLKGTLTHRPYVLGAARLARVPAGGPPEDLKGYLGPFKNNTAYDPAMPECAALAATLKGRTSAVTVQNVLDWLAANMRYEAGHPEDLAGMLKNRRGVCHHYSNLMVALCRAAGVPALVAHGFKIPTDGGFTKAEGSHGWVEVYLNSLGWVPVEPLNPNSLRVFGAAGYVFFDTSGHYPDDDHFRFWSLQGWPVDGRVIEARTP